MNRLKLWLYVLLLLGASAGNLYFLTGWLTARSVAHIDRELRSAAAVADARIRLLGASASAVADAAARAPAVVAAMADPAANPLGPAEDAVQAARSPSLPDGAGGVLVAVAGPKGVSARAGGAEGQAIAAPEALLVEASAGRRAQAWVRMNGTLWMVAAVPVGRNGAVAVGLPLDAGFTQTLHGLTGVDVTAALDGKVAASTAEAPEAEVLAKMQSTGPRRPVDIGRLGKIRAALDWPAPAMPILFADPPAARALALPLEGAGPATLVLSQQAAPFFSSLAAYQVLALVAMALFLLAGILLGLFMSEDSARGFPRELVAAADRISRGDFSARAPVLTGSAGVVASALNRAAGAAQPSDRRVPASEPVAGAVAAAPAAPAPAETPDTASAGVDSVTQSLFPTSSDERPVETPPSTAAIAAMDEPAPVSTPEPEPEAAAAAETAEVSFAPRAEALQASPEQDEPLRSEELLREGTSRAGEALAPPDDFPAADEDEPHWRSVFADFVRLRGETGEPADALSYERFRSRLERNREQLKDKHGARTVRFQPYVKEGKVALRATPVK
jgi:hypothetical protein